MITRFIQYIKCNWLPQPPIGFHHGECELVRRLSQQSELIRCKHCGRLFAINHDVRVVLPWHCVRNFYKEAKCR